MSNHNSKICGFTFVRNAEKFDYPVIESINSILPICDKFIICLGNSDDNTEMMIKSINSPKIEIIHSIWDDSLREGGVVLSVETNKAFDAIPEEYDWCFYIQADEVVHESYLKAIKEATQKYNDNKEVEGLLFHYKHFYGSYNYYGDSRKWYRREIRIIRNNKQIRSHGDAQGFRINGNKLKVKLIPAYIFHYGWVKSPFKQKEKQKYFNKLWHDDNWMKKNIKEDDHYDYFQIDSLSEFKETHPEVMIERIKKADWDFSFNINQKKLDFLTKLLYLFEKITGKRLFEYKNYEII